MKKIITEACIPLGEFKATYSAQRIEVKIRDEGAGPYLTIRGIDDEADGETKDVNAFCLESIEEIDQFATILKDMLKEAEEKT